MDKEQQKERTRNHIARTLRNLSFENLWEVRLVCGGEIISG